MVNRDTKLCISIAEKTSNFGASMHNAAYEALGLNYLYLPIKTTDTKGSVAGMRALGIAGMSVSIPHKQDIMPLLDNIDDTARTIGAVNTVVNIDGVLTGYNYDWVGAVKALEEVTKLADKKVVILGAGGAARAIVYGLLQAGAVVTILNRTAKKGQQLASEFGCTYGGEFEQIRELSCDVLVNATSVGSQTNDIPLHPEDIPENVVLMDIVILPVETNLIKAAKARGCKTIPGYRMLIHQALRQFAAYTGQEAPFAAMEKALLAEVARQS